MKTGAFCVVVLLALAAHQSSAAFHTGPCFGGRCGGFQSTNNGFHNNFPSRFGSGGGGGGGFGSHHRFGPARSPFGPSPSPFGGSSGGFSSSSRFGGGPFSSGRSHFSSGHSRFSSPSGAFGGPSRSHFSSTTSHLSGPSFGRFNNNNHFSPALQSRFASATPDQRYQAQLAANRQLAHTRRQEQHILRTGNGLVQPGTPSAALAHEKRADPKSLALGNQALQQILYLQNLVGAGRRRR